MNNANSQWSKVVKQFMQSDRDIIKIHEPVSPVSMVASIRNHLRIKHIELYCIRRGDDIYLIKDSVIPSVSLVEAIAGKY